MPMRVEVIAIVVCTCLALGGSFKLVQSKFLGLKQNSIGSQRHVAWSRYSTIDDTSAFLVSLNSPFDDDLPNILGINPIEAAIIFGALYYFYGPATLYEYAREAGKFFSTYAPIVKDISLDIFNEFRDYFEEDSEREKLKKRGLDIDNIPRRTSNILARFQEGLKVFSGTSNADDEVSTYNPDINNEDRIQDRFDVDSEESGAQSKLKRRKKKEVLEARNVDIDELIRTTDEKTPSADFSKSFSAVQERLSSLTGRAPLQSSLGNDLPISSDFLSGDDFDGDDYSSVLMQPSNAFSGGYEAGMGVRNTRSDEFSTFPSSSSSSPLQGDPEIFDEFGMPKFPSDFDESDSGGAIQWPSAPTSQPAAESISVATAGAATAAVATAAGVSMSAGAGSGEGAAAKPSMTKFQLQMSGQWNQQVLMQEQASRQTTGMGAGLGGAGFDNSAAKFRELGVSGNTGSISGEGVGAGGAVGVSEEWMLAQTAGMIQMPKTPLPLVNDIPSEISAFDSVPIAPPVLPTGTTTRLLDGIAPSTPSVDIPGSTVPGNMQPVVSPEALKDLLQELDKDYMSLRQRFVSVLEGVVASAAVPVATVGVSAAVPVPKVGFAITGSMVGGEEGQSETKVEEDSSTSEIHSKDLANFHGTVDAAEEGEEGSGVIMHGSTAGPPPDESIDQQGSAVSDPSLSLQSSEEYASSVVEIVACSDGGTANGSCADNGGISRESVMSTAAGTVLANVATASAASPASSTTVQEIEFGSNPRRIYWPQKQGSNLR